MLRGALRLSSGSRQTGHLDGKGHFVLTFLVFLKDRWLLDPAQEHPQPTPRAGPEPEEEEPESGGLGPHRRALMKHIFIQSPLDKPRTLHREKSGSGPHPPSLHFRVPPSKNENHRVTEDRSPPRQLRRCHRALVHMTNNEK